MLENSYGMTFFLKTPRKPNDIRKIYVRITVDGKPRETSTNEKWDIKRWNQKTERAIGTKEDARVINAFLDLLLAKVVKYKTELLSAGRAITVEKLIACIGGNETRANTLLEEFAEHNREIEGLVQTGDYAKSTWIRFKTTLGHVREFIAFKYNIEDIRFIDLDFEFIKDLDFYLRTVRKCNNNSTLKYITNFRKIVGRAIDKEIIEIDPFRRFKKRRTKANKRPITSDQLRTLETKVFASERLTVVRDIFVFQCYTGLAYIDVYQLRKTDIQRGIDGEWWIISNRQKTDASTNVPLLPKAMEIMKKYENDPLCLQRNSVLPVRSNQKCNEYLKEIATLCNFDIVLNTHKARRTFASTIALKNGVPINIVKEMLGHSSVAQTEQYAITDELIVASEMSQLKIKLANNEKNTEGTEQMLARLKKELIEIEGKLIGVEDPHTVDCNELKNIEEEMIFLRNRLLKITG